MRIPTLSLAVQLSRHACMVAGAHLLSAFLATLASAQSYPDKSIRIVTLGAGGGSDFEARLIAQGIAGPLGQAVIVDNRGSGLIAGEIVSKAPPDGYTVLVAGGAFMIGHLLQKTPYNSVTDFSPVTLIASAPNVLVVHPSLHVKSVKELIALAKAKPGALNYGAGSIGSSNHLGAELFKSMAGVNLVRVNYKGTAPAVIALLTGEEIQVMFHSLAASMPHAKTGRLAALAVTSAQPSALAPGLPTVAASGLPGYEVASADGAFVPVRTPPAIVQRLNQEIVRLLKTSEVREKFVSTGTEVIGSSPENLAGWLEAEIARMGKVIKDVGIRVE